MNIKNCNLNSYLNKKELELVEKFISDILLQEAEIKSDFKSIFLLNNLSIFIFNLKLNTKMLDRDKSPTKYINYICNNKKIKALNIDINWMFLSDLNLFHDDIWLVWNIILRNIQFCYVINQYSSYDLLLIFEEFIKKNINDFSNYNNNVFKSDLVNNKTKEFILCHFSNLDNILSYCNRFREYKSLCDNGFWNDYLINYKNHLIVASFRFLCFCLYFDNHVTLSSNLFEHFTFILSIIKLKKFENYFDFEKFLKPLIETNIEEIKYYNYVKWYYIFKRYNSFERKIYILHTNIFLNKVEKLCKDKEKSLFVKS